MLSIQSVWFLSWKYILKPIHWKKKILFILLQNICEDIFIPRAVNFYTGLLYNPPGEIATELKQLLEECAYPNQNKGEIVRSPTSINVYWKLISLLRRSKKFSWYYFCLINYF